MIIFSCQANLHSLIQVFFLTLMFLFELFFFFGVLLVLIWFEVFFFNFYFYFNLLYNTVLVLPYIGMNPPRVYMSSQT